MSEIYIIRERINALELIVFIRKYISGFTPMTTVYEYPQHDTDTEFKTDRPEVMMDYLIENNKCDYRFYFSNLHFTEEIRNGVVIFNKDHTLTMGIWVDDELEEKYAEQLYADFSGSLFVITRGELPPDNYPEFKQVALGI